MKRAFLIFLVIATLLFSALPFPRPINAKMHLDTNIEVQTLPIETFKGTMKIETFASPDCSYAALIETLNSTNTSLFIEMYSFSHPYILDVIGNLSVKGVNIIIILQKNHASYFENNYTYWVAWQLYQRNVHVYWANSTEFRYTHAKFVIIDNKTIIVESENWAKLGIPKNPTYGNRGWGIIIENTDVADYFLDVFLYDLSIATPYSTSESHGTSVSYTVPSGSYKPKFNVESFNEYVEVIPVFSPDFSENLIIQLINSANVSLYIEQMYIYSSLTDIVNAIISAKQRGVDVKIILDPRSTQNNQTAQMLLPYNISMAYANTSEYPSPHAFETMHNKGMIIDGKIVLISSINWSPTSLRDNREAGVIVKNAHIAQYYQDIFDYDWQQAKEYLSGGGEAPPGEETPETSWWETPTGQIILLGVALILVIVIAFIKKKL